MSESDERLVIDAALLALMQPSTVPTSKDLHDCALAL